MSQNFRFISLGGDCQPGHHSRRIMSYQDIPFVFDWLETPVAAVAKLIETEFAQFFAPENLVWKDHGDFWSVTDSQFGIGSNHHFKTGAPTPIEQVPQTFRVFGRRFMAMLRSGAPIIFLRRWIELDGEARDAAAQDLHACLRKFMPDCVLLYLQPHDSGPPRIEGNFISAFNPATSLSASWAGYTALYSRNFNRALRLANQPGQALEASGGG